MIKRKKEEEENKYSSFNKIDVKLLDNLQNNGILTKNFNYFRKKETETHSLERICRLLGCSANAKVSPKFRITSKKIGVLKPTIQVSSAATFTPESAFL